MITHNEPIFYHHYTISKKYFLLPLLRPIKLLPLLPRTLNFEVKSLLIGIDSADFYWSYNFLNLENDFYCLIRQFWKHLLYCLGSSDLKGFALACTHSDYMILMLEK